ncbi:MAG: hypothetical protein R3C11_03270 [Planctomycetaceae bacterium]
MEWTALRLFGNKAWKAHRQRQIENGLYGRDDFIISLPDTIIDEYQELRLVG